MEKFTRKFLATLGIEDDKADEIISRHSEVVNEIKSERDELKSKAEELDEVQKQLNKYKKAEEEAEKNAEKDPYKVKYEAIKEEYENYKKEILNKETTAKKTEAYRNLLKDAGVSDKRIDAVLKVSDIESLEFDDEGKVKDADKITESIKTEWSDFIQTTGQQGASVANPPTQTTSVQDLGKLSMADYIKARNEMK